MQVKSRIPASMINFKNKSEQMRYIRVAQGIIRLNDSQAGLTQNDTH